jgi:hypothetical protein
VAVPFWRSGRDRGAHEPTADHQASLEVEGAMRRVAEQDTPENRRALFELLLASTLLAATPDASSAGTEQGLATITGEDGPSLPVFTRIEALLAWRPTGYAPVALTGRTLFETAARYKTAKIEVNPASVPRGWISRAEIDALAHGQVPRGPSGRPEPAPPNEPGHEHQAAPAYERGQAHEPAPAYEPAVERPSVRPPEALIEAARRALEAQPHAVAGWLFATVAASGPAQLMVGVQLADGLDRATEHATMQAILEETWARSADADRLRFMVVAGNAFRKTLAGGAGELIFKR